jgi:hypothetical protein
VAKARSRAEGRPLRVYVDTSVFGGVHDDEFRSPSERFFAAVRGGDFVVLVSEALVVEISNAPPVVQATFESHRGYMEPLETTAEAAALAEAYLAARVVPANSSRRRPPRCPRVGRASRCRRQLELQASGSAAAHPRLPCRERAARLSLDRDPLSIGGDR